MNKGFGVAKKKPQRKKSSKGSGFRYTGLLRPGTLSPKRSVRASNVANLWNRLFRTTYTVVVDVGVGSVVVHGGVGGGGGGELSVNSGGCSG